MKMSIRYRLEIGKHFHLYKSSIHRREQYMYDILKLLTMIMVLSLVTFVHGVCFHYLSINYGCAFSMIFRPGLV